jgi:hypothetical protein
VKLEPSDRLEWWLHFAGGLAPVAGACAALGYWGAALVAPIAAFGFWREYRQHRGRANIWTIHTLSEGGAWGLGALLGIPAGVAF